MITILLTEEEKRQTVLLEGMAAGIEAARQCLLREVVDKRRLAAQTSPPPPPAPNAPDPPTPPAPEGTQP